MDLHQQQKIMSKISKQPIETWILSILSTSFAAKMGFFVRRQTNVALEHLIGFGATSIYPPVLKRGHGQSPICR